MTDKPKSIHEIEADGIMTSLKASGFTATDIYDILHRLMRMLKGE